MHNLNISQMTQDISNQGFFYQENVFPISFIESLQQECDNRSMQKANIGNQQHKQINEQIRNDSISWLNDYEPNQNVQKYQDFLIQMQSTLNQNLYLSLNNYETHFARYDKGNFYKKHKDNFQKSNNRIITLLTYLNKDWQVSHGGQLRVYKTENEFIDFAPKAGSVIIFISSDIEHEVLPSHSTRYSLTSWFRKD